MPGNSSDCAVGNIENREAAVSHWGFRTDAVQQWDSRHRLWEICTGCDADLDGQRGGLCMPYLVTGS